MMGDDGRRGRAGESVYFELINSSCMRPICTAHEYEYIRVGM